MFLEKKKNNVIIINAAKNRSISVLGEIAFKYETC